MINKEDKDLKWLILFYKSPYVRSIIATPCIVFYYGHSEWFAYYL